MTRTLIATIAVATLSLAGIAVASEPYIPTDIERARWTMSDMMAWRTVFDAYRLDNNRYPAVKSVEEARAFAEPVYISHAPLTDAWGHPYRIESDADSFRIVSAGSDGQFDESSWTTSAKELAFDADAVANSEGKWMFRSWSYLSDGEKARRAINEIRALRTAIEGYARVHNVWPAATNMLELRKLIQPDFIKFMPVHDPWGTEYLYEVDPKVGYRVVSAGADRTFDRSAWNQAGVSSSYADDLVANGDRAGFFRSWEVK